MQKTLHILSLFNSFIFLLIAAFHYYWALGGRYGFSVALPEIESSRKKLFVPGRLTTALVATFFLGIAFLFAGLLPVSDMMYRYGLWAIAGITLLRAVGDFNYVGFFKKKTGTSFASYDSKYFSPLCLYIAISSGVIAAMHFSLL